MVNVCSRRQFLYYKGKLGAAHAAMGDIKVYAHTHIHVCIKGLIRWSGLLTFVDAAINTATIRFFTLPLKKIL